MSQKFCPCLSCRCSYFRKPDDKINNDDDDEHDDDDDDDDSNNNNDSDGDDDNNINTCEKLHPNVSIS